MRTKGPRGRRERSPCSFRGERDLASTARAERWRRSAALRRGHFSDGPENCPRQPNRVFTRWRTPALSFPPRMNGYFNAGDWLVIIVYLGGIIGLGVWFGKDQRTTRDYFLGSRNIPWWGIGV